MPELGYKKDHLSPEKRGLEVVDPGKVKEVTILEEGPTIGWPPYFMVTRFIVLNEFLQEEGVKCLTGVKVKEIADGTVKYTDKEEREGVVSVDAVIVAGGRVPDRDLYQKLAGNGIELWEIGDCTTPEKVERAVNTANYVARQ